MFCKYFDKFKIKKNINDIDIDFDELKRKALLCLSLVIFLKNELNSLLRDSFLSKPKLSSINWDVSYHIEKNTYRITLFGEDISNLDIQYEMIALDPDITITKDETNQNQFNIEYPPYDFDVGMVFFIQLTNSNGDTGLHYIFQTIHAYRIPIIKNIYWDSIVQMSDGSYTMTIDAEDIHQTTLDYFVTTNDDITVEQDNNSQNTFHITYPKYENDRLITFHITVMNENNEIDTMDTFTMVRKLNKLIITNVSWNNDYHVENESYIMTISTNRDDEDLTYQVTCNDSNVTVTQDTTNGNVFHITYPDYNNKTIITYNITVTSNGENSETASRLVTKEVNVVQTDPPSIIDILWSDTNQWELQSYVMTIIASDPNDSPLSYQVTCNDSDVTITQDTNNENKFHVTYGDLIETTSFSFDIEVTNPSMLSDSTIEHITVHAFGPPTIDSLSWDDDNQYEQTTYILTISATDPQGSDMSYELTTEDSPVTIIQDNTDKNKFHVTYGNLNSDKVFSYSVKVTNENGLFSSASTSINVKAYEAPIIDSISWDNTDQWEQNSYVMTIDAHDPQGLDLSYQVTCGNSNVTVEQDTTDENKFHITYPNLGTDQSITFTITVTNEDNLSDTTNVTILVHAYEAPVINSVTWNDDNQWENQSYVMTIDATDPQGLDLNYLVTCDDSNVTIVQDTNNENVFHITYGEYSEDTNITYSVVVINTVNMNDVEFVEVTVHNDVQISSIGVIGGGYSEDPNPGDPTRNTIEYITITTPGNSIDFGDLSNKVEAPAATSNGTNNRGTFSSGYRGWDCINTIEYVTITTPGDASDFGDLSGSYEKQWACSNKENQRGVVGEGNSHSASFNAWNEYFTINSPSNSVGFGYTSDSLGRASRAATSNGTGERGITGGGYVDEYNRQLKNVIDYITINTPGDALVFGELLQSGEVSATSNKTDNRGVFLGGGGESWSMTDITYVTITTPGNASDFGVLVEGRSRCSACSNGLDQRGITSAGKGNDFYINSIEYITINTLGNASDFGDLLEGNHYKSSTSNG